MGKQKTTTDTKHDDVFNQAGTTTGTGKQSGTSYGGGMTEKSGEKTGISENKSVGGSNMTGGGTGTMTGVTTGTGTGVNTQTGKTTGSQAGKTGYDFRWVDRPETADVKALRDYKGTMDPTISYRAASERERLEKYGGNPLGAGTPAALRDAQLRQGAQNVDQRMAQEYQQDAFRRDQEKLGTLTSLAQMTAPIREMFGQTSDQTSTGVSDTTGTNTSTNTSNTSQNTANQNWQDMTNFANSMGIDIQSYLDQGMEANYGASEGEQEQTGTSNQSGSSSGTGQQTVTQPSNFLGNALGAGASIGSAALM
jgi:hypothetical protein